MYGLEAKMSAFYFLIYFLVDVNTGQTWAAILTIMCIDIVLVYIRHTLGIFNVSRQTLVDERFLR
jgi:hypothetical protein